MRFKILVGLLIVGISFLVVGCASNTQSALPLHQSTSYYNYIQPNFEQYQQVTEQWLLENRHFISQNEHEELAMNSPFSRGNRDADKAILLVHGLGDSPFSFVDVSSSLADQGFYVEVVLLPGHGSDPKHMQDVKYEDWQRLVDHYANLLKDQYKEVWLGGFSTGGNLVTIHAIEHDDISGLMLFSPGFQTLTPVLEKFTPLVGLFTDGWSATEDNFAKYNSAPINSALAYSKSAALLREKISGKKLAVPTLMVVSEADSVIDSQALLNYFQKNFTHPKSQLIWYGGQEKVLQYPAVHAYPMVREDLNISTASHMNVLFAPDNHYYGVQGIKRICENSFSKSNTQACKNGHELWFSAWGYRERGKVYARLTWNPYYTELEAALKSISSSNG